MHNVVLQLGKIRVHLRLRRLYIFLLLEWERLWLMEHLLGSKLLLVLRVNDLLGWLERSRLHRLKFNLLFWCYLILILHWLNEIEF